MMAPTEILARQHYAELSEFFGKMGYRTGLLVGSMTPSAKKKVINALAVREIDFVIGTHALIEETVALKRGKSKVIDRSFAYALH